MSKRVERTPERKAAAASNAWSKSSPQPLFSTPELPDLDFVPDPVRDYVKAVSDMTETPPDLAFGYALAVGSAATRNAWEVLIKRGWSQPLALWTLTLLESGNMKSAVEGKMTAPLQAYERLLVLGHAADFPERQTRYEIAVERAKQAKKAAVKNGDGDEEAARLAKEAEALRPPPRPRLMLTDATPEATAAVAEQQGGCIAVFASEGDFIRALEGRYSNGQANFGFVNEAWSGESGKFDIVRKGSRDINIPRPYLAWGQSIQPDVMTSMNCQAMMASGFASRPLYAVPQSLLGRRELIEVDIPPHTEEAWEKCIRELCEQAAVWHDENGHSLADHRMPINVRDGAKKLLEKFRDQLEPRLARDGDAHLKGWGSKLAGQMVRIAAVLTLMDDPTAQFIATDMMRGVLTLATYYIEHAKQAQSIMQGDAAPSSDMQRMARWLFDAGDNPVRWRQVQQAHKGSGWDSQRMEKALAALEGFGWVRLIQPQSTGGRPVKWLIKLHPLLVRNRGVLDV